ncbi:hypothetical protein CDD83_6997 [Cordyceps sp. RAO-2017]|nr:hypothetical protein CDD83_6997 [Cordyceps sp. RAO-2017]
MLTLLRPAILLAVVAAAATAAPQAAQAPEIRGPFRMQNLVTFGDSYTDEGRYDHFEKNHEAPPEGRPLFPSNKTFSGGYAWPHFVANFSGARTYNYAVGGAMCSYDLIHRTLDATQGPFPDVLDYQVPAFKKDAAYWYLYPEHRPDNTVYALWIGTNDLGPDGFLDNKQQPGQTIDDFVECAWRVFDQLYAFGGRRFVLFNMLPLESAPMYAAPATSGRGNTIYWRDPAAYDVAAYVERMRLATVEVNAKLRDDMPVQVQESHRWPDADVTLLDAHAIFTDVLAQPDAYLDAPADVTTPKRVCLDQCVESPNPLSSFMWYDELHPAEKMEQILSQSFNNNIHGRDMYGTTYRG